MLNLNSFLKPSAAVHFIGCGGVGTAPLMRIFHQYGFRVSGSDLIKSAFTEQLQSEGLTVHIGPHDRRNLPQNVRGNDLLVVYTSAAAEDNPELAEARSRGGILLRRGEALGLLLNLYPQAITVSGSHGKTSISSILAFALSALGCDPGYLIGGAVCGWGGCNGSAGARKLFVSEVDESDGTHTLVHSYIGVVPNVEDDHAWSLGGTETLYRNFRTYAAGAETLIYVGGTEPDRLFADHPHAVRLEPEGDFSGVFGPLRAKDWGSFQKRNALTALAVLDRLGFPREKSVPALAAFPGVERRMSMRYSSSDFTVIEDYAHHPTELRESIRALREVYPGRHLTVIFQPHRYARLERYFSEFTGILSTVDQVYVTPVFAAWTASGRYNSDDLAAAIRDKGGKVEALHGTWQKIALHIASHACPQNLIAVIGAGDLKEILPYLSDVLKKQESLS